MQKQEVLKSSRQLEKIIQIGLLTLVAIMPFHAFLSVWLGSLTHHEAIIQGWKEALLLILAACAIILIWLDPAARARLRQPWIITAGALIALGLVVTAIARPGLLTAVFGIKTDLEFLLAGVLAALVATPPFVKRLTSLILIAAAIVTGYDALQIFLLPPDFLTHFGYGPNTILPYQHITSGTSALRFPATLGGPNQLGTYVILPLCLATAAFIRQRRWWQLGLIITSLLALVFTFSRSAWIGAAVALGLTILVAVPSHLRRRTAIITALALGAVLVALPFAIQRGGPLQYFVLHSSLATYDQANRSDTQHASSLESGLSGDLHAPLGHGLGTAGPATFHVGTGNIIENYYLQIGYEMGLIAIVLFVLLIAALVFALAWYQSVTPLAVPAAAALIGVSLVGLVLPSWVDSTTALVTFIAAGAVTGLPLRVTHV